MVYVTYIKRFFLTLLFIIFLTSCGLIGGDKDIEVGENAVLSGPPLAIPPDFDINSENTNQPQVDPAYALETDNSLNQIDSFENQTVYESTQDENLFLEDTVQNTGEIQSFETFNPRTVPAVRSTNTNTGRNLQRTYRQAVPSDGYDFSGVQRKTKGRIKRNYAQKRQNTNTGFGIQSFEETQSINSGNLSKEEEFLLEDLLNQKDSEFLSKGDSD